MSKVLDGVEENLDKQNVEDEENKPAEKEEKQLPPREEVEETPEEEQEKDPKEEEEEEDNSLEKAQKQISDLNRALAIERAQKKATKGDPEKEELDIEELVAKKVQEATQNLQGKSAKENEEAAMTEMYELYPELYKHWNDVLPFVSSHFGSDSVENIKKGIQVGISSWEAISKNKLVTSTYNKGKEEGRREALNHVAESNMANLPSGGAGGIKEDAALTPSQREAAKKGNVTEKEYKHFSGGETFEIPVHGDVPKY